MLSLSTGLTRSNSGSISNWEAVTRQKVTKDEVQHFIDVYESLAEPRGVEVPAKLLHKLAVAMDKKSDDDRFHTLSLRKAGLSDDQTKVLALALWDFPIVGRLDLRYNSISHHGVSALMELMRHQMGLVLSKGPGVDPPGMDTEGEKIKMVCLHVVMVEGNPVSSNAGIMDELDLYIQAAIYVSARLNLSYAFVANDRGKKGFLTAVEAQSAVYDFLGPGPKHWEAAQAALAETTTSTKSHVSLSDLESALLSILEAHRLILRPSSDSKALLQSLTNQPPTKAKAIFMNPDPPQTRRASFDSFPRVASAGRLQSRRHSEGFKKQMSFMGVGRHSSSVSHSLSSTFPPTADDGHRRVRSRSFFNAFLRSRSGSRISDRDRAESVDDSDDGTLSAATATAFDSRFGVSPLGTPSSTSTKNTILQPQVMADGVGMLMSAEEEEDDDDHEADVGERAEEVVEEEEISLRAQGGEEDAPG